MAQKKVTNNLDRENRNILEHNYTELYEIVGDITGKITDEVYDEIKSNADLSWDTHVDNVSDLPNDAATGTTVMISGEGDDYGKVFRFDSSDWKEIFRLNPDAILELEERFQAEIDKKETPEGAEEKAKTAEEKALTAVGNLSDKIYNEEDIIVKLVESGSNANGYYMRWSDGKQECWGMSVGQATDTATGNVFVSDNARVEFPKPFDESYPIEVSVNVSSKGKWANAYIPNSTGVTVYQYGSIKATATFSTRVSAVGRWKK